MSKIKTIIAIAVVAVIVGSCILTASAQISSTTFVVWNFNDTKAAAKTVATAPAGTQFYAYAEIYSYSTGEEAFIQADTETQSTLTVVTSQVNIVYPTNPPLVRYSGGHGTGAIS